MVAPMLAVAVVVLTILVAILIFREYSREDNGQHIFLNILATILTMGGIAVSVYLITTFLAFTILSAAMGM